MTELIVISGVYLTPDGKPFPDVRLGVTLRGNTSDSFRQLNAAQITDSEGSYKFELLPGEYDVAALYPSGKSAILGTIQLLEGSQSASLNDYLISFLPGPNLLSEMTRLLQQIQVAANASSNAAVSSGLSSESSKLYADISHQNADSAALSEKKSAGNLTVAADAAKQAKVSAKLSKEYSDIAKDYSEIMQSVSDAYPDEPTAQKAVNDGIETREFFFVRSQSTTELAIEYTVSGGWVVPTGRWSMAGGAVTEALNEMKTRVSMVPNGLAGINDNIAGGFTFDDGKFAPLLLDDGRHVFIDKNGELRIVAADSDLTVKRYIETQPYTLPDGSVCSKIVVDPYNNIIEAWTVDGRYLFETPEGLKAVGNLTAPAQHIAQATAASDMFMNYGATRISVVDDLRLVMYILPTFGQSLAQGWSEYADDVLIAVNQLYPDNAWMFKSNRGDGKENPNRGSTSIDEIVTLKDTVNGKSKETACSSSAAHIISEVEKLTGKRIHILRYVAAEGGMAYRNLTQGTPAWSALVQGLIDAKRICERMGFKPVVLGIDGKFGETDTGKTPGMYPELYTRFLRNFDRNYNSEVKRIFGGDHPDVPIFIEQCSWQPHASWDSRVRQGQLDADGLGNIRFTGPSYQYPHPGDEIHINSKGQNMRGVSLARAVAFECFGTGFVSLKPRSVYWSGANTIDLYFTSSVEITKDESGEIVSPVGLGLGAGFNIRTRDGSAISITDVSLLGTTGVRLTVNNPTNTRVVQIGYGLRRTGSDNQSGPIDGARGLIRTTNGITNLYTGETEYQWLAAFLWEIN